MAFAGNSVTTDSIPAKCRFIFQKFCSPDRRGFTSYPMRVGDSLHLGAPASSEFRRQRLLRLSTPRMIS